MNYVWGTGTHVGRVRDGNEDSLFPTESGASNGPAILMVADGMGGAVAGEVASRLAVEAASEQDSDDPISPEDRVLNANPAVGVAGDELVRYGGTAVFAETPEVYGAEHLLTRRAVDLFRGQLAAKIDRKSPTFRLAPPTSPPSTSSIARIAPAFSAFIDPP